MTGTNRESHAEASAEEQRALDSDELDMVNTARNPTLRDLSDRDLSDLVARLRTRRNRARDIAKRQGREARSKSAPSGATPASGNAGTVTKHDYLNAALTRAMAERDARGQKNDSASGTEDGEKPSQHDLAVKAQDMKRTGQTGPNAMTEDGGPLHPDDPDASEGKASLKETDRRTAPSGALDHAGDLPSRERSRTRY